jgi:hypothetical protein
MVNGLAFFLSLRWHLARSPLAVVGWGGLSLCEPLRTLDAFCQYAHEQGVTHRLMSAQDIFAPESLQSVKV